MKAVINRTICLPVTNRLFGGTLRAGKRGAVNERNTNIPNGTVGIGTGANHPFRSRAECMPKARHRKNATVAFFVAGRIDLPTHRTHLARYVQDVRAVFDGRAIDHATARGEKSSGSDTPVSNASCAMCARQRHGTPLRDHL
jgi:hypothetical protein